MILSILSSEARLEVVGEQEKRAISSSTPACTSESGHERRLRRCGR